MVRFAVVLLILLPFASVASAELPHNRCGTPHMLATRPLPALTPRTTAGLLPGGAKQTRDGFGGGFTEHLSANFAIKWKDPSVTVAQATIVADALELAWAKYIDELGHAPCTGCDQFRLNAYISRDMATDNPGIDFAGGYAFIDDQGFPYFVISRQIFGQAGSTATIRAVAVHEFYHDIQFSTGAFAWDVSPYLWFWESTAEWASQEALPGTPDPFVFSGAYALKSELPLYHYGDPFGSDPVEGVHQYGSAIFFRHVTDKLSAPAIVVNTWEQSTATDEPLQRIADNLPSSSLFALYREFAARNAIWDYPWRDHVIDSISRYKAFDPNLSEIMFRVPAAGVAMTDLPRSPYGFGYSTIELARPATGRFEIEVLKAPVAGGLYATVVYGAPGSATYLPLEVTAASDAATGSVEFPEGVDTAYLVIGVFTEERLTVSPVGVAFRASPIEPEPEPEPEMPIDEGGCCSAGANPAGSLALVLLAVFAVRRRRTR